MEFILHFMYVVAIKDAKAWTGDTAAQLSMIGFWNLIIVWLKVSRAAFGHAGAADSLSPASHTMAVLPPVGFVRWHRPAGEHGPVYGKQLLRLGFLESMAP